MDIRKCISDLLSVHDCVIIPGFGGFIGNYTPARIDPVHHTFLPPAKKLLFNVNLKQNDGLLAQAVSESFGTDYDHACRLITEMADVCRHDLKSGKSFVIPGVGRLHAGREGNIQFEQEKSSNLLPDSYGLASFISPPISRNPYVIRPEKRTMVQGQPGEGRKIHFPRPLRWAAMLALPVGLATVMGVTQYDKIRNAKVSDAGILSSVLSRFSTTSLVDKKEAPVTAPQVQYQFEQAPSLFDPQPQYEDLSQNSPVEILNREVQQPAAETSASPTEARQTAGSASAVRAEDPYAVIVGAFRMKENAGKFISELKEKGVEATIYDRSKSGLYRVAVGTFTIREEAEQLLSSVKSGDFSGAWLLAK